MCFFQLEVASRPVSTLDTTKYSSSFCCATIHSHHETRRHSATPSVGEQGSNHQGGGFLFCLFFIVISRFIGTADGLPWRGGSEGETAFVSEGDFFQVDGCPYALSQEEAEEVLKDERGISNTIMLVTHAGGERCPPLCSFEQNLYFTLATSARAVLFSSGQISQYSSSPLRGADGGFVDWVGDGMFLWYEVERLLKESLRHEITQMACWALLRMSGSVLGRECRRPPFWAIEALALLGSAIMP